MSLVTPPQSQPTMVPPSPRNDMKPPTTNTTSEYQIAKRSSNTQANGTNKPSKDKEDQERNQDSTSSSDENAQETLIREDIFPLQVAIDNGLDATYVTMEFNRRLSQSTSVLQYAAHYAVDMTPTHVESKSAEPAESTESTESTEVVIPTAPLLNSKKSKKKKVTSATAAASSKHTSAIQNMLRKSPNDTYSAKRLGSGKLSTFYNSTDQEFESFPVPSSSSSEQGDNTGDDNDDESDENNYNYSGSDGSSYSFRGRRRSSGAHGLRRRRKKRVQRVLMGLGYAKILVPLSPSSTEIATGREIETKTETEIKNNENNKNRLILIRHCELLHTRKVVLAAADQQTLQDFVALAHAWRTDRDSTGTKPKAGTFTLYRFKSRYSNEWENQGMKRARPIESVVLVDGQLEAIIQDIREFVSSDTKKWYSKHGLPHRRSLLFYGAPGTGKTSTIKMLAGMFKLNACFLSFTSHDFSNETLHDAITDLPEKPLLVLEDVDVLFNEDRTKLTDSTVTFSGLLNVLDGLISVDGVISIFTTNHLEKLDQALIRGGRVDRRFEFAHPSEAHLCKVFKCFYADAEDEIAKKFAYAVINRKENEARSIATLQQHFIFTRKLNAEESVKMLPKFFETFYPDGVKDKNPLYL